MVIGIIEEVFDEIGKQEVSSWDEPFIIERWGDV